MLRILKKAIMKCLTGQHPISNLRTDLMEREQRTEKGAETRYNHLWTRPLWFLYRFFQVLLYQSNLQFHSFRAPNLHEQGCKVTLSQAVRASTRLCCTQGDKKCCQLDFWNKNRQESFQSTSFMHKVWGDSYSLYWLLFGFFKVQLALRNFLL